MDQVDIVSTLRHILEHGLIKMSALRRGDKSLPDLMNNGLGETMKLCLIDELKYKPKLMDSKMHLYMKAIGLLLEPCVHTDRTEDDREGRAMKMFVFKIIKHMYNLFLRFIETLMRYPEGFQAALNRVFDIADKKALRKIYNKRFLKDMLFQLIHGCGETKPMALSMLVTVMDKLPSKFRKCLLNPFVVFKLRRVIHNSDKRAIYSFGKLDPELVERFAYVFRKNGLRDRFIAFHPHWETIVRACKGLSDNKDHRDDCDHPIRVIAQLISNDQITCYEAIEINFAYAMTEFLYSQRKVGVSDRNVRKFLSTFLEFDDRGQITGWTAFKNLVSYVIDNCYKIQESIKVRSMISCTLCKHETCSLRNAKEHLIHLLRLLNYLCYLNENWYRWFNMTTGPKLLDKKAFEHLPFLMSVTQSKGGFDVEYIISRLA